MNKRERLEWLTSPIIEKMSTAINKPFDGDREALVRLYQAHVGLKVDGFPGTNTAQALYGSRITIARNRRELSKQVGNFKWKHGKGRRVVWTGKKPAVVRVDLHNGDRANIHKLFAEEFKNIFELACELSGYTPESVQTYNPRRIGGSRRLSMHSFGVAVDFDPRLNPMGGTPSMLREHLMFVEVFEWCGWTWGGRWKMKDDMHFQRKR